MANIFDENSEFKRYIKKDKAEPDRISPPPTDETIIELNIDDHHNKRRQIIQPKSKNSAYLLDLSSKKANKLTTDNDKQPKTHLKQSDTSPTPTKVNEPDPKSDKATAKAARKLDKIRAYPGYNWAMEHVRTFLYGIIIFFIGYLALNYSAYYEVAQNLYYEVTNQEHNPVLRTFTDNTRVDELITTDVSNETVSSIPEFDFEITPPGTRIIIPRLAKNVPVVSVPENNLISRDWAGLENDLQSALRDGVVHYPGTAWPGQSGNIVLTGHSSYYPWDPGRFKDVFAVLHNVKLGDEIVVFHNQTKFRYQVTDTKVVLPQDVEILGDYGDDRLTLLTCTPIGTNLKRLIVTAKPI